MRRSPIEIAGFICVTASLLGFIVAQLISRVSYIHERDELTSYRTRLDRFCQFERFSLDGIERDLMLPDNGVGRIEFHDLVFNDFKAVKLCLDPLVTNRMIDPDNCGLKNDLPCMLATIRLVRLYLR